MPRDGSEPRPERPEPGPKQLSVDQVRLNFAKHQRERAEDREIDLCVELVMRDQALAEKDKRIAELEGTLAATLAELQAARMSPAIIEPDYAE